ncbi:uncharacterized protein [Branchiostoma lanceolatum]|uniref:uncharacterized protein n=1 Tax=Branchiostoma lanceolatum TaxID=7740 RepID=UPI003451186A
MKTHSLENGTGSSWPKGSYCILKYGRGCPAGFALGKLGFLGGTKTGEVPDGSSDGNSIVLEYCCRHDGLASSPIRLPPRPPFYVLRSGGKCQQVEGINVREEWIEYRGDGSRAGVIPDDDGDFNSHKLYYCLFSVAGSSIPTTPFVPPAGPDKAGLSLGVIVAIASSAVSVFVAFVSCLLCLICQDSICCCCSHGGYQHIR